MPKAKVKDVMSLRVRPRVQNLGLSHQGLGSLDQ